MRKRKEKYIPKSYESVGNTNDVSANIYMSMLMSHNWNMLTKNQQILYVYCKAQLYAEKTKPKPMIKQIPESEQNLLFTMNRCKYIGLYHLYSEGNRQSFQKDMQSLIEYGFVELVENHHNTRSKNIYKLSNLWREDVNP